MSDAESFVCDGCGEESQGQPSAYVSPEGTDVADRFCLTCWKERVKSEASNE